MRESAKRMICIGRFVFPNETTRWRSTIVEALSKERREVTIEALLVQRDDPLGIQRRVERLEEEIERFDQGQATLSLRENRFFEGRRRELVVAPSARGDAARVQLKILTLDRFERSEELHTKCADLQPPTNIIRALNRGNHATPLFIEIQPSGTIDSLTLNIGTSQLTYDGSLGSGDKLTLDSETNTAVLNDTENVTHLVNEFPWLEAGWNSITAVVSGSADGVIQIEYRDLWV